MPLAVVVTTSGERLINETRDELIEKSFRRVSLTF